MAVALASLTLAAASSQAATPRFQAKAVGNSLSGRVTKKAFPIGAGYGLYFRDNRRSSTRYTLCAVFRGVTRRCVTGKTRRRGAYAIKGSVSIFNPQRTGRLVWRWKVAGRPAASWAVNITAGD